MFLFCVISEFSIEFHNHFKPFALITYRAKYKCQTLAIPAHRQPTAPTKRTWHYCRGDNILPINGT